MVFIYRSILINWQSDLHQRGETCRQLRMGIDHSRQYFYDTRHTQLKYGTGRVVFIGTQGVLSPRIHLPPTWSKTSNDHVCSIRYYHM